MVEKDTRHPYMHPRIYTLGSIHTMRYECHRRGRLMEIHHISILLVINVIQYGKHISKPNVDLRAIGRWFGTSEKPITCDDVLWNRKLFIRSLAIVEIHTGLRSYSLI